MGLFGKSAFLDRDVESWCLETWAWLMRIFGGMTRLAATPLVLPSLEFFPPTDAVGAERAIYVFSHVKRLMGMSEWPCRLEPFDRPPGRHRVGQYAMVKPVATAAGTFRTELGQAVISYASDLVDQPMALIAVLAHELAHYLLLSHRRSVPGGADLHELATDLVVAYAGFGVFGANAAFRFEQHQDVFGQGWSAARQGYFSERTWGFALALFLALKGVDLPEKSLKPSVSATARNATRYLNRNAALLAPLRQIA